MAKKDKVSKALAEIGAAWAVRSDRYTSPDDGMAAQVRGEKMYHIHPDVTYPEVTAILRFRTLDEILEYVDARKRAAAALDGVEYGTPEWDAAADLEMDIMQDYWGSRAL